MLEIYTWSVLITGIFFTSFGAFAYVKNSRDVSTKYFALLSAAFAVWSYAWFLLLASKDAVTALSFSKILAFGATFIPIFYLSWVLSVLEIKEKRKHLIFFGYVITFIFALLSLTDFYIPGVRPILFFPFWPVAGSGFTAFIVFGYIGLVLYALIELIRGFLHHTGDKKYQIGYLILGSFLGFGGGAVNFPLMYGYDAVQPFGLFAVMASPFVFSYAAIKYKLLDIKVVATQFLAGALNVIFIISLILSKTATQYFFNTLLLGFVLVFTILLLRGIKREIEQREKIEELAKNLEKTNRDLEGANVRLQELDQLKSEFVSLATHQIRGPLTAIKGYASLLIEGDYGKISAPVKEAVNTIMHSAQSLVVVVGDFLDVSRIEQGRMKYDLKVFDLKGLVHEVVSELKPNLDRAGLGLTVTIDESLEYSIDADRVKIKQVIANIFDNSIKYTPKGSIAIALTKASGKILFSIKDTGIGIPKDTIPKLFAKFSRAKDANETNIIGTGLGLYLAKELIKGHNGRVWAESEGQGKGSQFYIELNEAEG